MFFQQAFTSEQTIFFPPQGITEKEVQQTLKHSAYNEKLFINVWKRSYRFFSPPKLFIILFPIHGIILLYSESLEARTFFCFNWRHFIHKLNLGSNFFPPPPDSNTHSFGLMCWSNVHTCGGWVCVINRERDLNQGKISLECIGGRLKGHALKFYSHLSLSFIKIFMNEFREICVRGKYSGEEAFFIHESRENTTAWKNRHQKKIKLWRKFFQR